MPGSGVANTHTRTHTPQNPRKLHMCEVVCHPPVVHLAVSHAEGETGAASTVDPALSKRVQTLHVMHASQTSGCP